MDDQLAGEPMNSASRSGDGISVTIRFRPLNDWEYNRGDKIAWYVDDKVFGHITNTEDACEVVARPMVKIVMDGTVFAYGVTSSGKTHTMHFLISIRCSMNDGNGRSVEKTTLYDLYEKEGQSPWYDNLCRPLTDLIPLIENGVRGVTSNPVIFQEAILTSSAYNDQILILSVGGMDSEGSYVSNTSEWEAAVVRWRCKKCRLQSPVGFATEELKSIHRYKGHYTEGAEVIDDVLDILMKEQEIAFEVQTYSRNHEFLRSLRMFVEAYVVTKTATGKLALEFREKNGLNVVVLLPSWTVGPFICSRFPDSIRFNSIRFEYSSPISLLESRKVPRFRESSLESPATTPA
ncbi:transaldolase family protein [Striga asiatica]|uniref:Transaldolase family protein n=1 Tax=Striga asiatica TaxID=4170 RepID=A0A5A7QJ13_STRAF|nr:transaldolase family protein [Striga asiatica]